MNVRYSTDSAYTRVLQGLHLNFAKLIRAQEQTATGRRILRPSDDPIGTGHALSINRRTASVDRFLNSIQGGLVSVDRGAAALEDSSGILTDVRELVIKGMNGTLNQDDRDAIAAEIELLREQLLDVANTQTNGSYLFAGTNTSNPPFSSISIGGLELVQYAGNDAPHMIRIGDDVEIAINVSGLEAFGKSEFTGVSFAGLTGLATGTTADQGVAFEEIELRHDSTDPGTLGTAGIALVNGGAGDTLLNDNQLVIDTTAGTVQLGNGPVLNLPDPADPTAPDFVVVNELGGELHLDFTGFTGSDFTGNVRGDGSISVDGANFVPLDFLDTDLELKDPATGNVLHVDTTGVKHAGVELAQFSGAINVFDTLEGIARDLRNGDGLEMNEVVDRLELRLGELDRNHDNVLIALGTLGSRSERMSGSEQRLESLRVQLRSAFSQTVEADLSEVVLEMSRAEQTLQLAQATGVRLIQTNLLRYL